MLNFEEELKKFKPSMEVDDIEDSFYREDTEVVEEANQDRIKDHKESER